MDKDYRVHIYKNDELLCTYELHVEIENDECVDVSSCHVAGEPFFDPLEDDAVDLILEAGLESGVGIAQGCKIKWKLVNKVTDE